ncbi:hypothetical protein K503DRAFT_767122 [Rhizopogon vinicolor AM-OR11-026]|uniref:Tetrapyrrole methylase domain-containing protein n=1 Tax=Rhizopogon vinicolor AM-OR11-026 TaxID=1314800 RepID=A0A1B7NB29_9AGAM|nr:hypothetical protein K503DRAFT_767122 [Rhizopogon vinicolor AM-OR11-026]
MLSCIKESDNIFYFVCGPITEAFIHDNSTADCFDLSVFYDKTKGRYDTYIQMCEAMLKDVRAGHDVFCVFYGHPGVLYPPLTGQSLWPAKRATRPKCSLEFRQRIICLKIIEFDPALSGCKT